MRCMLDTHLQLGNLDQQENHIAYPESAFDNVRAGN